jgi:hypothetical protein
MTDLLTSFGVDSSSVFSGTPALVIEEFICSLVDQSYENRRNTRFLLQIHWAIMFINYDDLRQIFREIRRCGIRPSLLLNFKWSQYDGNTAAHTAAIWCKDPQIFSFLKYNGADLSILNSKRRSVMDLCLEEDEYWNYLLQKNIMRNPDDHLLCSIEISELSTPSTSTCGILGITIPV